MYENERERFIFIPIYFPEFDLSGAKLKLYYLVHTIPIYEKYVKDTNRIFLSNFTSLCQQTIMKETSDWVINCVHIWKYV